ncbi:tail assembly chaperone [Streptococcus suis]|uniref:tail assembly chaperone n=1 Tax=Streptococcus suis TaxID=1307 RepID=UPI003757FD8D
MEIKVKSTVVNIKFDYALMFSVDKELATRNKETGQSNNDGVGALFLKILNKEDSGIVDLIKISMPKSAKNVAENDIIAAIGNHIEHLVVEEGMEIEAAYDSIFNEIKQEMVDSGFFKSKISKYLKNLEKARRYFETQEDSEMQLEEFDEIIGTMKSALS